MTTKASPRKISTKIEAAEQKKFEEQISFTEGIDLS